MAAANASTRGGPFCSRYAFAAVGSGWHVSEQPPNSVLREAYGRAIFACQKKAAGEREAKAVKAATNRWYQ